MGAKRFSSALCVCLCVCVRVSCPYVLELGPLRITRFLYYALNAGDHQVAKLVLCDSPTKPRACHYYCSLYASLFHHVQLALPGDLEARCAAKAGPLDSLDSTLPCVLFSFICFFLKLQHVLMQLNRLKRLNQSRQRVQRPTNCTAVSCVEHVWCWKCRSIRPLMQHHTSSYPSPNNSTTSRLFRLRIPWCRNRGKAQVLIQCAWHKVCFKAAAAALATRYCTS